MEQNQSKTGIRAAYSPEGYIVDQARVTDVRYGCRLSSKNGCGWIAVFNLLRCLGDPVPHEQIIAALSRRSLFRGALGTSPLRVRRYLKRRGHATRVYAGKKRAILAAGTASSGILVYRHVLGWHYAAFLRAEGGAGLRFFNAGVPSGTAVPMDAFLAERNLTPFVLLFVAKQAKTAARGSVD